MSTTTRGLVVTGGASGIGAEIARLASSRGYRVGVLDANAEGAAQVASEMDHAQALHCDVTNSDALASAFSEFGEIHSFVNCAGILRSGALLDLSEQDFRDVIDVNLTGVYIAAREAARVMRDTGGSIVNLSSINASQPSPAAGAYVAAKAGVEALTKQMSLEWSAYNIRVNAVAPGFVDAGMAEPFYADPKVRQARTDAVPAGRLGTADDIARAVLFLSSDEATYITGQILSVDGALGHSALHGLARE